MISEVSMTQTPKDMVFSQTSVNTRSILKVVELNRLKSEKESGGGVITGGITRSPESQPVATDSFSEVFLKPEPQFESTMFNEPDHEFFQDLVQWCSDPAKEEPVQTDSLKHREENSHNTDTLHTSFSPQGWDVLDANSPGRAGFYTSTPNDPLSPNTDGFTTFDNKFLYNSELDTERKMPLQEQIWDITNLPNVLGDLASEKMVDLNPHPTETIGYYSNTHMSHDMEHTTTINTHKMFIDEEDSLDLKLDPVIPREVENNNVVISEYIINDPDKHGVMGRTGPERRGGTGLSLDVTSAASWPGGAISTPEVLSYVEQLEKEKCVLPIVRTSPLWPLQDTGLETMETYMKTTTTPADSEPVSLKSESHLGSDVEEDVTSINDRRKRHNSEDSDETYTPYVEYTPRKYKRRKPNKPIKDMILALEESQQLPKARRGRPPKRRVSTVSSVCSIDDNASSASTHEVKYRELRDKNNEASKRSRMNRKLKELQMEQLAVELEERNKKLQCKADILEDMTKKLKEALMTAILHK